LENREELTPERELDQETSARQDAFQAGRPAPVPEQDEFPQGSDEGDGPLTIRQWIVANSVALAIVAAVLILIVSYFRFEEIIAIGTAALGLSFVVFVHEMGHFLVAKWCNVHVTTFSIGFGPAIPGCSFQWGETTYKLALIPIGGYVQMVGQVDGDESSDGNEDDPRSYRNKSVGQRMAIISAGVIMNVLLAIICFVVVYQGPGKERPVGAIGRVDTKTPAFQEGLHCGAKILQIGSIENPNFEEVRVTVMQSHSGEKIKLVTALPGQPPREMNIEPRQDKTPIIGIDSPRIPQLATRVSAPADTIAPVWPGSTAALSGKFQFGDRIVATTDPNDPQRRVKPLPIDAFYPDRLSQSEFIRRMKLLAAERVILQVERERDGAAHRDHDGEIPPRTEDIAVEPMYGLSLGVRMQMGSITAIRKESAAEKEGLVTADPSSSREGDLIQEVEVTEPDGTILKFDEKDLDPERLPWQLKQWAQRIAEAAKDGTTMPEAASNRKVKLTIRRHRVGEGGRQFDKVTPILTWDDGWRFDDAVPLGKASPMAIPELGLAYQIKTVVAAMRPGLVANNPLQVHDVIRNCRYTYIDPRGKEEKTRWASKDLEEGEWASITYNVLRAATKIAKLELKVERGKGDIVNIEMTPVPDPSSPLDERGWLLMPSQERQRANGVLEAVGLGLRDTHRYMMQVFHTLRGIITGRLSLDIVGGPVLIAKAAYLIALLHDFGEFVFFLGLISVNLAVVNFLPIPVLDGGHMVFLCYEKLRGRPASETVRVVATYAGLAMILCLFLFVTWNDFMRFVWPLF
jgi:regulator of sigma E protease